MPFEVVATRAELRATLGASHPGLVPTMGSLHEGHLALIAQSAKENAATAVSIFVNPSQFGDPAELARYPRDLDRDVDMARTSGASLIFAPPVEAIYPPGSDTWVEVGDLGARWEGAARPGHFRGVATVVAILLNLVKPARSYFGVKDFQQLQIVRRLHQDLALPGIVVGCETVREADGFALSSRNARLSPGDRERASRIPMALRLIQDSAAAGERDTARLEAVGRLALDCPGVVVDYLAVVDAQSLRHLATIEGDARVLIAVEIGGVRLIDNVAIARAR